MNLSTCAEHITNILESNISKCHYHFAIESYEQNEIVDRRTDEKFHWASVYKLFLLAIVFRQIENGELDPETKIRFDKEKYQYGQGVVKNLKNVQELSIVECCNLVIALSDNICSDQLLDFIGINKLNEFLKLPDNKLVFNNHELIEFMMNRFNLVESSQFIQSNEFHQQVLPISNNILKQQSTNALFIANRMKKMSIDYFDDFNSFLSFMDIKQIPSKFCKYMNPFSDLKLIGKTGNFAFGYVNNEAVYIFSKSKNKVVGSFVLLIKDCESPEYISSHAMALAARQVLGTFASDH